MLNIDKYGRDTELCKADDLGIDNEPCFDYECKDCPYDKDNFNKSRKERALMLLTMI